MCKLQHEISPSVFPHKDILAVQNSFHMPLVLGTEGWSFKVTLIESSWAAMAITGCWDWSPPTLLPRDLQQMRAHLLRQHVHAHIPTPMHVHPVTHTKAIPTRPDTPSARKAPRTFSKTENTPTNARN